MIGKITNGGLVMTSRPLIAAGDGVAASVGRGLGEGEGGSVGDGDATGDGEAVASRVKSAQGVGGTLAQSLWSPRGSPGNGLTCVAKLPLESAIADPATLLLGGSQLRLMGSLGRNPEPETVMTVFASPAVTSRLRKALTGVGVGLAAAGGEGGGLVGAGESAAGARLAAISRK